MKTWQRILVVIVLLGIAIALGLRRERMYGMNAQSVSNLHVIGLGLLMYTDDNNDKLPDLSDAQSMKQALVTYISKDKSKAEKSFVHPTTGKPYQPNSSLSYQERKGPNASAAIAVVYEDEPAGDGTR